MFDWIADPNAWIALATLTALEIVLGIDNIIFISILVGRLPPAQRDRARKLGLGLAMVSRLLLLGGEALRGFSEALLIGIVAGTYSSIWISSAVALSFGLKAEHVFPTVRKDPIDQLP